jgi:serine/threonine-protein kinase
MGEVWQATDLVIGRTVAIKILKDEYLGDPGFLERFRAEARHAALVNHEGIANVFDYGEEEGSAYLVMELVPGEALSAIIERERVLSTDRVLDIVAQTASALQAAHAAGLVHRDIKPGNLLITPDGRVKITDFGIARIADQVPLTATGQVMGTVQYLSPEQASGHSASPSTDIYSLGIVAYEALAGRRPFTGESQVAIAMAQINETPPELPATIAEPVRNLVYSSIAKKPSDRPATAQHLARAAQSLRRGDVAAAAAAVPGILGAGSLAATAGANYGQPTQATQILTTPETAALPVEENKRNPWTWPLVAIISVLAVVLIAVIIAIATNPSSTPINTSSAPPQASQEPSIEPEPSETLNVINEDELLGLTEARVKDKLESMGFRLDPVVGIVAPSADQVGRSYKVDPVGAQPANELITVSFYAPIPTPTAGAPDELDVPAGPYLYNSVVTLQIPTYIGCPSGTQVTGFNVSVSGATAVQGNPLAANSTSVDIQTGASDATVKVSYTVSCGSVTSPKSPSVSFPVTAS